MNKSKDATLLVIALAALLVGIFITSKYLNKEVKQQPIEEVEQVEDQVDSEPEILEDNIEYENDVEEVIDDTSEEDPVFTVAETMPEFPGGMEVMNEYVYDNFEYPHEAIEVGAEGKVFIEFIVDDKGKMTDIRIVKDAVGFGCAEEALRVIKKLAKQYTWKPGVQLGEKVRVKYRYPLIIKQR